MKGSKVISDWGKVKFSDKASRALLVGALTFFMQQPDKKDGPIRKAIQHFTTKGDFPADILQVLEKYHATPDYDNGFESIFDIRDFTSTNESGFEIADVASGLTFGLVKPGEKAKVYQMSGSKAQVTFDLYGGGLGWNRLLIDDKKWWTLEDNAIAFRNKAYSSRAANFYALIEAITNTQSWAAVTPATVPATDKDYNAIRDINTINAACNAILRAVKDKGYGVTANSTFFLLADVSQMSRINRALSLVQQAYAGSGEYKNFKIVPIWTLMLTNVDKYYVGIPKIKSKGGYRMDLTIYDQFDILAYQDVMAGWMRYGGGIGDTDLIKKCDLS